MARKGDDLLAELEQLGADGKTPSAAKTAAAAGGKDDNDDPLADLQAQLAAKPAQSTSRPGTPRLSSSTTSGGTKKAEHTPASSGPPSGRNSTEERGRAAGSAAAAAPAAVPAGGARKSADGSRTFHTGVTPDQPYGDEEDYEEAGAGSTTNLAGGGWWGSIFSTASAAVKQAETLAKELRNNEEAGRWAEQVRALGAGAGPSLTANLQTLSSDLRARVNAAGGGLPSSFTALLQHIAPPISAHERLQIHTTHDVLGYPSLDPLIYRTFERTMAQVEGGELLVIQRGSESRGKAQRRGSSGGGGGGNELQGYRGGILSGGGWSDGPWWRDEGARRSLGTVAGLREGSRLARVGAEAYAREFFEPRGGVEEAAQRATETLSESNPVRSSDIFLAIQAVSFDEDKALFADDARAAAAAAAADKSGSSAGVAEPPAQDGAEELVAFAVYLHDPIHGLSFATVSQGFPARWAQWLDASTMEDPAVGDGADALPESIRGIVEAGGVDPREWVAEWMEEVLGLAVGVVAQRYVARRMGVGEGGLGRGKRRIEEDTTGGEAARAV